MRTPPQAPRRSARRALDERPSQREDGLSAWRGVCRAVALGGAVWLIILAAGYLVVKFA